MHVPGCVFLSQGNQNVHVPGKHAYLKIAVNQYADDSQFSGYHWFPVLLRHYFMLNYNDPSFVWAYKR